MSYDHIKIPASGDKITIENNKLVVSDNPILGFIEGDGIGGDITRASMRVWNAAVEKAYGGKRKVHWAELFLGEKAAGIYDGNYFPAETLDAVKDLVVSVKGPLTTPVGAGAHIHASAGDLAATAGERGLIAGDVLAHLRTVMNPTG